MSCLPLGLITLALHCTLLLKSVENYLEFCKLLESDIIHSVNQILCG